MSTVTVTMMPAVAERLFTPRVVGVEFPFGHPFGLPGQRAMQRQVLELALRVLAGANHAGTRIDFDLEWPQSRKDAYRAWQPKEPSPIVAKLLGGR